jgi:hypothetical protein
MVLALVLCDSGCAGGFGGAVGDGCGTAEMSDTGANGCGSMSAVDDCNDVAASVAGGVAGGSSSL